MGTATKVLPLKRHQVKMLLNMGFVNTFRDYITYRTLRKMENFITYSTTNNYETKLVRNSRRKGKTVGQS